MLMELLAVHGELRKTKSIAQWFIHVHYDDESVTIPHALLSSSLPICGMFYWPIRSAWSVERSIFDQLRYKAYQIDLGASRGDFLIIIDIILVKHTMITYIFDDFRSSLFSHRINLIDAILLVQRKTKFAQGFSLELCWGGGGVRVEKRKSSHVVLVLQCQPWFGF